MGFPSRPSLLHHANYESDSVNDIPQLKEKIVDSKIVDNKLVEEILKRLDTIAGVVEKGGKYAWEQLIRYQTAEAISDIFMYGTMGMLVAAFFVVLFYQCKSRISDPDVPLSHIHYMDKSDYRSGAMLCRLGMVIGILITLSSIATNVPKIIYPEAYAVRSLLDRATR